MADDAIKFGSEGGLQAPTRHALGWQEPDFYDATALEKELDRVFDICHGCRRCFNLCNAFPTLFDLIDASKTGEVDVSGHVFGIHPSECFAASANGDAHSRRHHLGGQPFSEVSKMDRQAVQVHAWLLADRARHRFQASANRGSQPRRVH